MTSYAQWRASVDTTGVRRVTYVCGPEHVLVDEVIDTTITQVGAKTPDLVSFSCATVSSAHLWSAASLYPLNPGAARLVIVRDAERLSDWEPLRWWLDGARRLPGVHLLFVSDDADLDQDAEHIVLLRQRRNAQVVRCTRPADDDLIAWVRRRSRLDVDSATRLLTRVDWRVADAADAAAKLDLFDGTPSPATIEAICANPTRDFIEALVSLDKPTALRAADTFTLATIATLAVRVDQLAALYRQVRADTPARDIRGVPAFLVRRYLPIAKHYDAGKCAHRRRVLAVVEDAYRSGARIGVAEALVALW